MANRRGLIRPTISIATLAAAFLTSLAVVARPTDGRRGHPPAPRVLSPGEMRAPTAAPARLQQFRGGASNNDIRAFPGAPEWAVALPGSIRGATLVGSTLFLATEALDGVAAIDATSGALKWFRGTPSWVHGDPVLFHDLVIATYGHLPVNAPPGGVTAFDTETGRVRWTVALASGAMPAPALSGDTVFVLSGDGCLSAFAAATGEARWRHCDGSPFAMSSPRIRDGKLFAGAADGTIAEWDATTGAPLWRMNDTAVRHAGDVPVALSDSVVFTTGIHGVRGRTSFGELPLGRILATSVELARDGRYRNAAGIRFTEHFAFAVRESDGRELWRTSLGIGVNLTRNLSGTPVLVGDALFIASPFARQLFRLDPGTGRVIWSRKLGAISRGAVTVIDQRVLLAAQDSTMRAFDARTGVPLGVCRLSAASTPFEPVAIGGSALIGDRSRIALMVPLERLETAMRAPRPGPCAATTPAGTASPVGDAHDHMR